MREARNYAVFDGMKAESFAGELLATLNHGALCLMISLGHRTGLFDYAISTMHCMTVSLAQGGEGVGAMWGEGKTREYLHRAGFRHVRTNRLAHDIQNNWYVARK